MADWAGDHKAKLVMEVRVVSASGARLSNAPQPIVVTGDPAFAKGTRKDLALLHVDVNSKVSC